MLDERPDDDALMGELRQVIGRLDPLPGPVRSAARAAIEWRTLDDELSALVHDRALRAGAPAAQGVAAAPLMARVGRKARIWVTPPTRFHEAGSAGPNPR